MHDSLNDIIFEGENILWSDKPDKLCFVWRRVGKLLPAAIIWLLFDGFFIGTIVSSGAWKEMGWFLFIFFALHLIPVWLCIGQFVKCNFEYKNVVYAVTDKRIITRNGIVGLDFENLNYTDISNIRVDVSVLEKMRHVGSVFIMTSSGSSICLAAIPEPYQVYKKVNKIFMDMKSDIEYPNALRPEVNPGYRPEYKD